MPEKCRRCVDEVIDTSSPDSMVTYGPGAILVPLVWWRYGRNDLNARVADMLLTLTLDQG